MFGEFIPLYIDIKKKARRRSNSQKREAFSEQSAISLSHTTSRVIMNIPGRENIDGD